jgi:hypothetical protein
MFAPVVRALVPGLVIPLAGIAACTGQIADAGDRGDSERDDPEENTERPGEPDPVDPDRPAEPLPTPQGKAVQYRGEFRRLTHNELMGAFAAVLRIDRTRVEAAFANVPGDIKNGFGFRVPRAVNAGYAKELDEATGRLVSGVDLAAAAPASAAMCKPATWTSDGCLAGFAAEVGRVAYRRPLDPLEVEELVSLSKSVLQSVSGATGPDAVRAMLRFLLQSPELLHLWERRPSEPETKVDGLVAASSHEVASRLSFLLFSQPPDAELAAAADEDRLRDPGAVRAQVERMLRDSRSERIFRRFYDEWLKLDALGELQRAPAADGAKLTPELVAAMRLEVSEFVRHVTTQGEASFAELLTRPLAIADRTLAPHYGLAVPAAGAFTKAPRPSGPSAGLLTTGAFLVAAARHDGPSPTHFGVAVRGSIMCDTLPPPPPGQSTELPPIKAGATLRERTESHVSEPRCASCHRQIDPIGFAGLAFDQLGRTANHAENTKGTIYGYEDGVDRDFDDVAGLAKLLVESEDTYACFARQWMRFVSGQEIASNAPLPAALAKGFVEGRGPGDLHEVVTGILSSDFVRFRESVND